LVALVVTAIEEDLNFQMALDLLKLALLLELQYLLHLDEELNL
jgi:hypothetical protein